MSDPNEDRFYSGAEGPAPVIRPIALCLFRRDDGALLLVPGYDPVKQQLFYRPLGGEIDFGERSADAARREVLEELGAEIEDPRLLGVFENIFTYVGKPGHEIVFLYKASFADRSLYDRDVLMADEHGASFEVHWVPAERFSSEDVPLYPEGLRELLGAV